MSELQNWTQKVQNCSHWLRGPTVSFAFQHQWKTPMGLGGRVVVALGRQSVHRPFKVRKMEQIKLGSTCPLHMPCCNRVHVKCPGLSDSEQGTQLYQCYMVSVPLVSSASTMGGIRSGNSSSPACSPVARNRLRSRKSGTSMAKSIKETAIIKLAAT